jgi:hypothetical protein
MDLRLFKDTPGGLTVPGPWLSVFSSALKYWGCELLNQHVVVSGTAKLHPQWEITFREGLVPGIVKKIEALLTARSVIFKRLVTLDDNEILDVRWELSNVSVW